jgi:hypothetical protein
MKKKKNKSKKTKSYAQGSENQEKDENADLKIFPKKVQEQILKDPGLKKGFLRLNEICSANIQGSENSQISKPAYLKYVPIFQELFKRSFSSITNDDQ